MQNARPKAPGTAFHAVLTGMSLATFAAHLPATTVMAQDLATTPNAIVAGNGAYLVAGIFVQLLCGALSDRFGRRGPLIGALMLFTLASVLCAVTTDFVVFLIARAFQCVSMAFIVLSRAILRDTLSEEARLSALGTLTLTSAAISLAAPLVGGAIAQSIGWRYIFVAFAIWSSGTLWFVALRTAESHKAQTTRLWAFFKGYRRVLYDVPFWVAASSIAFSLAGYHMFSAGLPTVAARPGHWLGPYSGAFLAAITGGYALGGYLSNRARRWGDVTTVMLSGRVLQLLALGAAMGLSQLLPGGVWLLLGMVVLMGVGDGLTVPGATAALLNRDSDVAGLAVALSGGLTFLIGGLATFFMTFLDPGGLDVTAVFAGMAVSAGISAGAVVALRALKV